jgi:1-acyl-sn-glycerol-3-phosphate acyltransferase
MESSTLSWLLKFLQIVITVLFWYIGVATLAASAVAVWQEQKIWQSKALPSLSPIGQCKVFLFNVCWMVGCLIGSLFIILKWIVTLGQSDIALEGNRLVENIVAQVCVLMFVGKVQLMGLEHLPATDMVPAPVYVANHASQIDVGVVYFLNRRFKWISKLSVLYIPGVGLVMGLSRHVFIDRRKGKNNNSVSALFDKSNAAVQSGLPMFFFPQGTRRIAERLPAKDGAFILAQSNRSLLIPISIEIPLDAWNSLYPVNQLWGGSAPVVKITVHPSILPSENSEKEGRELLKQQCMDQIYSVLPKYEDYKVK